MASVRLGPAHKYLLDVAPDVLGEDLRVLFHTVFASGTPLSPSPHSLPPASALPPELPGL